MRSSFFFCTSPWDRLLWNYFKVVHAKKIFYVLSKRKPSAKWKVKERFKAILLFFYPSFSYAQLTFRRCHFPKSNKIFKEVDDDGTYIFRRWWHWSHGFTQNWLVSIFCLWSVNATSLLNKLVLCPWKRVSHKFISN